MPSDLLTGYRACATTDLAQARAAVAARFCPHRLSVSAGGRLDLVHNSAPIGDDLTLNYMRYGSEVHITPGRVDDFYLVQVPVAGFARIRVGDTEVLSDRCTGTVSSPTRPLDMVWGDGCEKLVVYIRRTAVQEVAGTDDDVEPVIFDPRFDVTALAVQSWVRLVQFAVDALSSPAGSILSSPLVTSNFEQTLISGLLSIQPNSAHTATPSSAPLSRPVRTALALIEDRPDHPWKVSEIAHEVGVSTRSLQELFARELGTTPLQRLRRIRLDHARQDLVDASPADTSVTTIATRWGFFHVGRFAEVYRATYQELPSATLGR
ncbi:AraC family transcriptional regulator [Gordonia sp. zg691]|uniref:AraC family transcriptional regulator n=1 Tax=Gordonia jinghuaiqii TaxID=2758710 RepID=A0A7D7LWW0_9ACTN|nr:AraC family transcriptional regulator [Gordonia jinghuaiqii]MBD0863085.1 AraC family transcriptional regulator [Gordonia jinghuaiqii]MCR5980403.1 helix-turn-helix domain-containing protein [Gordonia jinghuaiqii]QMT01859.1 AraC family transcriptional regulator [Gordonia jinghuaiqii]